MNMESIEQRSSVRLAKFEGRSNVFGTPAEKGSGALLIGRRGDAAQLLENRVASSEVPLEEAQQRLAMRAEPLLTLCENGRVMFA